MHLMMEVVVRVLDEIIGLANVQEEVEEEGYCSLILWQDVWKQCSK